MSKKTKIVTLTNGDMSFLERVQNALHSDEIEALYDELEPGQRQAAEMVIVLNKFQVTPMLYSMVAKQLETIANNLLKDIEYSPGELMGDDCWTTFGSEGRREMDLCIKHFATHPNAVLKDTHRGTFKLAR